MKNNEKQLSTRTMKAARILLLAGISCTLITGCGAKEAAEESSLEDVTITTEALFEEEVAADATTEATTESVEETEDLSETFNFDNLATEEWQKVYKEQLDSLVATNGVYSTDFDNVSSESVYCYYLYDFEADNCPELLVTLGSCEADFHTKIYTCQDGVAVELGEISSGHSSFYTDPEQKGIIVFWGHMGAASIERMYFENGTLTSEELQEEDISNDSDADYTYPYDILPGSTILSLYQYGMTLPIINYLNETSTTISSKIKSNEEVEQIFTDTIQNNGNVYVVRDYPYEALGQMDFNTLCQPGNLIEYADEACTTANYEFADLNGDGQEECLASTLAGEGTSPDYVVLSYQAERVYAYIFNYTFYDYDHIEDGNIVTYSDYSDPAYTYYRVHFNKDQVYTETLTK